MQIPFDDIESLSNIAKQVIPNINIIECYGNTNSTHTSIEAGKPVLYWDKLMCEYFDQVFFLLDSFDYDADKDKKLIYEININYFGVLFDHISKRYEDKVVISNVFKREAEKCCYPIFNHIIQVLPDVSQWSGQYMLQRMVVRLMILYHELGHLLFRINEDERNRWFEIVNNNAKIFDEVFGDEVRKKKRISKKDYKRIINYVNAEQCGDSLLVEEMAADAFALSKTYATMHLNIHDIPKSFISDNVGVGALRYLHLATSYVYIIGFWNQLLTMSYSSKKDHISKKTTKNFLTKMRTIEFARYEIGSLPVAVSVINLDIETWGYKLSEEMAILDPRVQAIMRSFDNNMQYCGEAIGRTLSVKLFNQILDEVRLSENKHERYTYKEIDQKANIVTWLAIQYDNFSGLDELDKGNYRKAIEYFLIALEKTIVYLGEKHRLTARVYNNLCQCYLVMYLNTVSGEIQTEYSIDELKHLASLYSNKAVECVKSKNMNDYDIQAASIFQNAGEVRCIFYLLDEALTFYLMAREIKNRIDSEYSVSKARTDISMAEIFFCQKRYLDAKKCCESIIDYYESSGDKNEYNIYIRARQIYKECRDMMNTGNAMQNIIESLMNGESVDLDQYNDWGEIYKESDIKRMR